MFGYIVIAALLPTMILSQYPFQPCPGIPPPHEVRIPACQISPCHVTPGTLVTIQTDFTPSEVSPSLTMEIQATSLGQTTIFPLPDILTNMCNWLLVGSCPTAPGTLVTHAAAFPIITDLHGGIPVQLRVSGQYASGAYTGCALLNFVID